MPCFQLSKAGFIMTKMVVFSLWPFLYTDKNLKLYTYIYNEEKTWKKSQFQLLKLIEPTENSFNFMYKKCFLRIFLFKIIFSKTLIHELANFYSYPNRRDQCEEILYTMSPISSARIHFTQRCYRILGICSRIWDEQTRDLKVY